LLSYSKYRELKEMTERAKQFEIFSTLNAFRDRASRVGITERDIEEEINKARNA